MMQFIMQHQIICTSIAYWVFSAVVSGMPCPMPNGSLGYQWAYNTLHTLVGNISTAFPNLAARMKP